MYGYVKGMIAKKATNYMIVEANGVGYKIFCDSFTINEKATGEEATIYTYLKVAEGELSLYGFALEEQKDMFEKLICVNGVGPKVALGVLSTMKVNDIAAAVISNDEKAFTSVPGIGKKTSQRLVMELKEKVSFDDAVGAGVDGIGDIAASTDAAADACAALVGLGYSRTEAFSAVNSVKSLGDTAEELVALALKRIGR